jgi:hypothetical protein
MTAAGGAAPLLGVSTVLPSGPVIMTREPSFRRLLANSKASRRVFFSALNVPVTPSTLMARTTYCIPGRPLNESRDRWL